MPGESVARALVRYAAGVALASAAILLAAWLLARVAGWRFEDAAGTLGLVAIAIGGLSVVGNLNASRDFEVQYAASVSTPGHVRMARAFKDSADAYRFALSAFLAGALVVAIALTMRGGL